MKDREESMTDDIPAEIDFSGGVRGRHAAQYAQGTNVILLDPDVATLFPDSASVNQALRLLAELARKQAEPEKAA